LADRQRYDELRQWALARVQSLSWSRMAQNYVEFWKEIRAQYVSNDRPLPS
jgi:glycosyltransferase involved in cell wall biosynthesis